MYFAVGPTPSSHKHALNRAVSPNGQNGGDFHLPAAAVPMHILESCRSVPALPRARPVPETRKDELLSRLVLAGTAVLLPCPVCPSCLSAYLSPHGLLKHKRSGECETRFPNCGTVGGFCRDYPAWNSTKKKCDSFVPDFKCRIWCHF